MENDSNVRHLLAEAFEVFVARTLGAAGNVASSEPGSDPDDASTIENEFSGLTWHNLIYYHYRWDRALLLRWSLTDEAYLEVLPSYLCSSLLWPEVESFKIAADLLAPIDTEFADDRKIRRFQYVLEHLPEEQRHVIARFLVYFLAREGAAFEDQFSVTTDKIKEAIDRYWGITAREIRRP